MSLYPVRSISQLPELYISPTNKQGIRDSLTILRDPIPDLSNYQAYATTLTTQVEKNYQWITDIPDGRLLIETSLSSENGTYVARKFDFGNFLRYIGESLRILNSRSYKTYLSQADADLRYLPLTGGTLLGALDIIPQDGGYGGAYGKALTVKQNEGFPQDILIINNSGSSAVQTTITNQSITVDGDVTCNNAYCSSKLTADSIDCDKTITCKDLIASNNVNVTDTITCSKLTASTDFNLADMVKKNTIDTSFVQVSKVSSNEISVHTGTTTTYNLVVKNDTKFNHDVIVGNDLSVMHNLSAINGSDEENTYHVYLKDVRVKGTKILSSDPGFSTDESVIGETVQGSTIKVGDSSTPSVYADSNGFTCTTRICNLTAQYACWA